MWSCMVPPRLCCQVIYVHWSRRIRIRTLPDRLEKANISYISARRRDRDEIPTTTPAFLGSNFSMKLLQINTAGWNRKPEIQYGCCQTGCSFNPGSQQDSLKIQENFNHNIAYLRWRIIAEHLIYNDVCVIQNGGQKTGSSYHFGYK